jgi:hypothetical protein
MSENNNPSKVLWLRMGIDDVYDEYEDLDDVAYMLCLFHIFADDLSPVENGIVTTDDRYRDLNYISLYVGDEDAGKIRDLTPEEFQELVKLMEKLEEIYPH